MPCEIKHRINENHYLDVYKTVVREKLSGVFLEEERRCRVKAKRDKSSRPASTAMVETTLSEGSTVDEE